MLPKIDAVMPVAELRFSRKAEIDLAEIADFSVGKFGIIQARLYRDNFQACFNSLCENPKLGRSANELAPGLRRIRQQAHVIFYQHAQDQVLVVRVLHYSMDFERNL
ncbi:MAG: type II toxin-antitoxin system RelE/ParE family toxin [Paracoccaceae bacterium]